MEIRKADSKGRVTGLEGGRHYKIDRLESGVVILSPTGIKEPILTANDAYALAAIRQFSADFQHHIGKAIE